MAVTGVPPVIAFWLLIALRRKLPLATPCKPSELMSRGVIRGQVQPGHLPQNVWTCERSFISDITVFAENLVVSSILQVYG